MYSVHCTAVYTLYMVQCIWACIADPLRADIYLKQNDQLTKKRMYPDIGISFLYIL